MQMKGTHFKVSFPRGTPDTPLLHWYPRNVSIQVWAIQLGRERLRPKRLRRPGSGGRLEQARGNVRTTDPIRSDRMVRAQEGVREFLPRCHGFGLPFEGFF